MRILTAILLLASCGDDVVLMPDAVISPSSACCSLLPDEDALRACGTVGIPIGTCAEVACPSAGGFLRFNVCGVAHDGGTLEDGR